MNSKSFTLIELMTVVAIVAILSGITLIGFNLFLKQGKIAKSMAFDSSIHFNLGWAMVGDWKMDDNAANSTVVDTSGNNNDGTFYNGGTTDNTSNHSVDGANGTALEFDGVDDYVEVPDSDSLDLTHTGTISFWARVGQWQSEYVCLVKKGKGSGGWCANSNDPFNIFNHFTSDYIAFSMCDGMGGENDTRISPRPSTGVWHHYLFTWDGSNLKSYLDGELEGTSSQTIDMKIDNKALWIGRSSTDYFNGLIDQVRIYSEAFSLSQVKYQYYTGLQRLYDKGLMSGKEYKSRIVKLNSES